MTPELWQAKKTIDSTLHPGMHDKAYPNMDDMMLTSDRYWIARLFAIPHVMFRPLESCRHSWDAYAWSWGKG